MPEKGGPTEARPQGAQHGMFEHISILCLGFFAGAFNGFGMFYMNPALPDIGPIWTPIAGGLMLAGLFSTIMPMLGLIPNKS